jgi:predicted nucleotidyltransferase component of viral defense system
MPASASFAGPTFRLEELAGRKVVALFDRAEARDFADVFALAQRYPKDLLIRKATEVDAGFDHLVLATMLGSRDRFHDHEIPIDAEQADELRSFFAQWRDELQTKTDHATASSHCRNSPLGPDAPSVHRSL